MRQKQSVSDHNSLKLSGENEICSLSSMVGIMAQPTDDFDDMFVTDFPKQGFGIVDYLQGRVHFALLDQMKLMSKSGMTQSQIRDTVIANVTKIIDSFENEHGSKNL